MIYNQDIMAYCRFWVKKPLKNAPKRGEKRRFLPPVAIIIPQNKKKVKRIRKKFLLTTLKFSIFIDEKIYSVNRFLKII